MDEIDSRFSVLNEESDQEQEVEEDDSESIVDKKIKKTHKLKLDPEEKAGVLYLSSVPEYMTVQKLRNTFEDFGEVGRTFFQPQGKAIFKRNKHSYQQVMETLHGNVWDDAIIYGSVFSQIRKCDVKIGQVKLLVL